MPFRSIAQRKWMFVNHPQMAEKWAKHTPKNASLPERVHHKARHVDGSGIIKHKPMKFK